MSTVPDEADIGLGKANPEPTNDEGPTVEDVDQTESRNGAEQPSTIVEILQSVRQEDLEEEHTDQNGGSFGSYGRVVREDGEEEEPSIENNEEVLASPARERPSSADGSLSTPDDTPSIQNSVISSQGRHRYLGRGHSPTPSLRPFDKRFQARLSQSPLQSPRPQSPAYLQTHSRQSSILVQIVQDNGDADTPDAPWEVVRWTKLRKISGQAFSELGKRNFGRPTCIAVSASIALGTSKGIILVFDYHQNLKTIVGPGTHAVESGSITSLAFSADFSTIAGGHMNGSIFTWEIARPSKPFLHIPSVDRGRVRGSEGDGHVSGVAVLHLGFLGTRHTALVSADDRGMAFSHLATRGMGAIARSVRTTRILGRYPEPVAVLTKPKKPSTVLAFAPLPLGNAEHVTDDMGLVAMLTPYLLVIVSTIPIAQTQHKATRPKELAAHGTMSAALAWFPAMKPTIRDGSSSETGSNAKLAYCWSNILTIMDISEAGASEKTNSDKFPELQFTLRKRWKAEEAIVAVQWLGSSVLGVLTISQQLIILEDNSLQVSDSSDLIKKHIYHTDLFSQQLSQLVEKLDEEDTSMHGVVADAFYMSLKAYKGRLFLLGFNDVSMGSLSNWADRLLALMENGNFIGAIELATAYFNGEGDKATVGLPEDDDSRHSIVQEKLVEMISASLKYAFGKNQEAGTPRVAPSQLKDLCTACFSACLSIDDPEFLFEDVYSWYADEHVQGIFLEILEGYITDGVIRTLPPGVLKDLVGYFVDKGRDAQLEEVLCRLTPETMDIDQVTTLCRKYKLYDALFYVWSQALGDYTTMLSNLLDLPEDDSAKSELDEDPENTTAFDRSSKIFPYLSYILTGRTYPTGEVMSEPKVTISKAEIYHFVFSGRRNSVILANGGSEIAIPSFPHLRSLLDLDTSSFLSMLNEAFEDNFLNGPSDQLNRQENATGLTEEQRFGMSLNRQYIISILLEVMVPPAYVADEIIYLDIFIARNIPKFPQFILLPGSTLHRVLTELCEYHSAANAEDCQLSVEYLLSVYQPPEILSMIPLLSKARFYRVIKSIYRTEKMYAQLLQACFEDQENLDAIFVCIADCLKPNSGLSRQQREDVRSVIIQNASTLVVAGLAQAASTIDRYTPDLHASLLGTLDHDDHARFQYLREVLEPNKTEPAVESHPGGLNQGFVEQYVRLLCNYDPHHVSEYIEKLKVGELRLDSVLPALESSGVVDAAVVLLAREGKVQEGIDRLTRHLETLGSALIGLFRGAGEAPDVANTHEAAEDLTDSLQKYTRVGIWICHGLSKSTERGKSANKYLSHKGSTHDVLSVDEKLWLDLVDSVVHVVRDATEVLDSRPSLSSDEQRAQEGHPKDSGLLDTSRVLNSLRSLVQETFTALLKVTSIPPTHDARSKDFSFLRIFRAFLNRASISSPSLANLRAVLAAIFSAYSYEESLLSLANRLLDKDLFVRVSEMSVLRKRGWRPLGQACEGCGRKVWGPGTGGRIWDAWAEAGQVADALSAESGASAAQVVPRDNGKGKAVIRPDEEVEKGEKGTGEEGRNVKQAGHVGALVIFSCRHIFHQQCLEEMQTTGERPDGRQAGGLELICPLCT
ncbi:Vacuolar protein sorting-associated protein 8 [Trapelia coarctata]|nr:Vacuolar protein sorting-associated protein 8 [Trapelia coarctata]